VSELLERAFVALGPGPKPRELSLVAETLRKSGDEEAIAALEAAADLGDAFEALVELAEASGVRPFTALDLVREFSNPGHNVLRTNERTS
jgi:hypothetical protein